MEKNKTKSISSYRAFIFLAAFIIITCSIFFYSRFAYKEKLDHRINTVGINTLELFYTKTSLLTQLYSYSLKTAANEFNNYIADNGTTEDYIKWLNGYYEHLKATLFLQDINVYFANDNILVDRKYGNIKTIHNNYDYKTKQWYANAISKPQVPVFSDVYNDIMTNRFVATASISLPDNKGVLAIDLHPDTLGTNQFFNQENLDTKSNFLMDSKGTIIAFYCKDEDIISKENIENNTFLNEIKNRILKSNKNTGSFKIEYIDGNKYSIFYKQYYETKYYSVTVIDDYSMYSSIGDESSKYIIIFIFLAFAIIVAYLDGYYLKKQVEDSDDVIDMLGNIYFCIYRVNLETNTYNVIRSIEKSGCILNQNGLYEDFFNKYLDTLDEISKEEFINTLSMENLKEMSKIYSCNMDKYFHKNSKDQNAWINIRIIRNKDISQKYILLCIKECGNERQQELAHIELLEEAVEALKDSAAAKRLLYSSVSHDMRTPLNCIIGISELMTANIDNKEKILDYIDKIKISGSQLLTLISNFLEMAQSENKALVSNVIEFDLEYKVQETCSLFNTIAENENKTFTLEYDVENNNIKGDANKLVHILSNILSNAFKYTKQDGIIKLSVKEIQTHAISKYQFIIEDNGIGMSEEFLQTISIPFNREVRDDTKNITGAGLGLSIVNSQVKYMGGTINIQSRYGKGTIVAITLPFISINNPIKDNIDKKRCDIKDIKNLSGIRVLIAEDNIVNMQIITELLKLKEIVVTQAFNGLEAVNIFKDSEEDYFDLLILDIQMPIMNGLKTAKTIRQMDRNDAKSIPIIALSANVFEEDVSASLEAGMNAHLAKPIDLPVLYNTFIKLLKK